MRSKIIDEEDIELGERQPRVERPVEQPPKPKTINDFIEDAYRLKEDVVQKKQDYAAEKEEELQERLAWREAKIEQFKDKLTAILADDKLSEVIEYFGVTIRIYDEGATFLNGDTVYRNQIEYDGSVLKFNSGMEDELIRVEKKRSPGTLSYLTEYEYKKGVKQIEGKNGNEIADIAEWVTMWDVDYIEERLQTEVQRIIDTNSNYK